MAWRCSPSLVFVPLMNSLWWSLVLYGTQSMPHSWRITITVSMVEIHPVISTTWKVKQLAPRRAILSSSPLISPSSRSSMFSSISPGSNWAVGMCMNYSVRSSSSLGRSSKLATPISTMWRFSPITIVWNSIWRRVAQIPSSFTRELLYTMPLNWWWYLLVCILFTSIRKVRMVAHSMWITR